MKSEKLVRKGGKNKEAKSKRERPTKKEGKRKRKGRHKIESKRENGRNGIRRVET